ncbi:hypothetical protein [Candidatus Phytoplasma fabacearum]|uniref:hypothetical protein n=1 Tax=Candidatus Phytoplasma fabacearum TaxID=2982628 RepID=UPI0030EEC627
MFWNSNININVYEWSPNYVKANILDKNNVTDWNIICVYGNPDSRKRRQQWEEMAKGSGDSIFEIHV